MISYVYVLNTYGEPCSTSSLCGCTGYTGKYYTWSLLSVLVFYYLWIGVQLPQGEYISYGRSILLVSMWCSTGYSPHGRGTLLVSIWCGIGYSRTRGDKGNGIIIIYLLDNGWLQ